MDAFLLWITRNYVRMGNRTEGIWDSIVTRTSGHAGVDRAVSGRVIYAARRQLGSVDTKNILIGTANGDVESVLTIARTINKHCPALAITHTTSNCALTPNLRLMPGNYLDSKY